MIYVLLFPLFFPISLFSLSIMLDPAGDAKTTGRIIDDSFERGIALQYVQRLKQALEEQIPSIHITITRLPGETVTELQNAHFANRMAVDLYISIHFFNEDKVIPRVYLYTYAQYDDSELRKIDLSFYRYDQAHLLNHVTTQKAADLFCEVFTQNKYKKKLSCSSCTYSLPFKPLVGIKVPALAFEIGLKNKDDWRHFIDPLCEGLIRLAHLYEQGFKNENR